MRIIAGLFIVFASIAAGYVMEKGRLSVLMQPAELLIIAGAAVGIILVSNSPRNLKKIVRAIRSLWKPPAYSAAFYLEVLQLLYVIMAFARRAGLPELESHVEDPESSDIFSGFPALNQDPAALTFLCDSIRVLTSSGLSADELDRLMAIDVDVQRSGRQQPVNALLTVADSLPGLGIVAAVLGVVVTMQALGGPAAEIGQKVAAALVGTFLGILLCYGVVGPLATHIQQLNRARIEVLQVLRAGLIAFLRGSSPLVAAEFARRTIPMELRPGFEEMDLELRRNTSLPDSFRIAAQSQQPVPETVA